MPSIILILPYFGCFPNYFDLWLQSCKNNSSINWLIFTDNDTTVFSEKSNITFINLTFVDFCKKFENYFDFQIVLNTAYKLCDYRPFYGMVLNEFVKNYDFWGYCDCDLIFGDIRKFATDEILSKCDKFLGHGHFSLQRTNDPEYSEIIKQTFVKGKYDYKYVYSHQEGFAFDEYDHLGVSYSYLRYRSDRFYSGYSSNDSLYKVTNILYPDSTEKYHVTTNLRIERIYDDIYTDITHFRDIKDTKDTKKNILYSYNNGVLNRVISEKSKIIYEEILYLHLMKRKMSVHTDNIDMYYIIPNKFVPYNENPTLDYMLKYGGKRIIDIRRIKNDYLRARTFLKIGTRLRIFKNIITNLFG